MGYSFRLTARVLLYAPSHREDNTYNGLCYTSRGAQAGTRNSSMGPPWRIDPMTHRTMRERSYLGATYITSEVKVQSEITKLSTCRYASYQTFLSTFFFTGQLYKSSKTKLWTSILTRKLNWRTKLYLEKYHSTIKVKFKVKWQSCQPVILSNVLTSGSLHANSPSAYLVTISDFVFKKLHKYLFMEN